MKVNGKWDGEVYYTYAEGPRKGKKDKEMWYLNFDATLKYYEKKLRDSTNFRSNGELISCQKYYGEGETLEINNWEDLKKLETLGKAPSEGKEVFYDCSPTI